MRKLHPTMRRSLLAAAVAVITIPLSLNLAVTSMLNADLGLGLVAASLFALQCVGIAAPFITWGNGDVWEYDQ